MKKGSSKSWSELYLLHM